MVPHIGSEESAGLAGSGGDWGVCVDAPVVVGRCAVGPPPLRRFFCAEGVAKMPPVGPRLGVWGVESLMEPPDRNPGRDAQEATRPGCKWSCFNGSPRDRNPGRITACRTMSEDCRFNGAPKIGIRGKVDRQKLRRLR